MGRAPVYLRVIYASQLKEQSPYLYSVPAAARLPRLADSSKRKRAMRLHAAPMSYDEKPKAKRPVASTDALSCTQPWSRSPLGRW